MDAKKRELMQPICNQAIDQTSTVMKVFLLINFLERNQIKFVKISNKRKIKKI